jgi:hypothetical protein
MKTDDIREIRSKVLATSTKVSGHKAKYRLLEMHQRLSDLLPEDFVQDNGESHRRDPRHRAA